MLRKIFLFSFLSLFFFQEGKALNSIYIEGSVVDVLIKPKPVKKRKLGQFFARSLDKNPKATAVILTLTLGPLGAHRIYLGTHYTVPIFYTLTLGGGLGLLPASDLVMILITDDISKYYNNSNVFMWAVD